MVIDAIYLFGDKLVQRIDKMFWCQHFKIEL